MQSYVVPGGGLERQWPMLGRHAVSNTTVRCAGNVEAFSLTAKDLHEVIHFYNKFILKNKVQGAIRCTPNSMSVLCVLANNGISFALPSPVNGYYICFLCYVKMN